MLHDNIFQCIDYSKLLLLIIDLTGNKCADKIKHNRKKKKKSKNNCRCFVPAVEMGEKRSQKSDRIKLLRAASNHVLLRKELAQSEQKKFKCHGKYRSRRNEWI